MNEAFESIKKGLHEAIDFSKGHLKNAKVTHITHVDVKGVRHEIGMTQKDFAISFKGLTKTSKGYGNDRQ